MKKLLMLLVILLIITIIFPAQANYQHVQAAQPLSAIARIDPLVRTKLQNMQPAEMLTVIVTLPQQMKFDSGKRMEQAAVIYALQARAALTQAPIRDFLDQRRFQGEVGQVISFWVFNGLSVTATPAVIQELAGRTDVALITDDAIAIQPAAAPPEPNLTAINAPALWSMGYTGQGVVVASLDSGVSMDNPDLAARWRGGSNSWYDPYNQHPAAPLDLSGHGTWTMGVMVAGEASGTSLGVAPQAQWIAARIFNDQGKSTTTAIHQAFQWLLDPDHNPNTADAPHVVNNSWTLSAPGCNLSFQLDLQSLRAVGIVPVFAAGNFGPNANTSASPANYPEALAVGAVDNNGGMYAYSSRGPSACGETSTIYPDLVAPGVDIKTTDLYGLYNLASGTSLSAPHVAGGLALLLQAFPNSTAIQQQNALLNTALDLGSSGPDNNFGNGRVDLLAAYQWLLNNNNPTPTPTSTNPPTATPTSPPTATPSSVPTATPTSAPTATPTNPPTATPTSFPTATPTNVPTMTPTPNPTQSGDFIFSDGFEAGNLNAWSAAATGSGRLTVTSSAALAGAYGLQAQINNTTPLYTVDQSPAAEASYHARFYFSPHGVTIGSRKVHDLLTGLDAQGKTIFRLQIQSVSGNYQVRAQILTSGNKQAFTNWYSFNNSSHSFEVSWQAASTSTGTNGTVNLWLDGALKQTLTGLANGSYRLEETRLGPQNVSSGISGTEFFDAFVSTRTSIIGP